MYVEEQVGHARNFNNPKIGEDEVEKRAPLQGKCRGGESVNKSVVGRRNFEDTAKGLCGMMKSA